MTRSLPIIAAVVLSVAATAAAQAPATTPAPAPAPAQAPKAPPQTRPTSGGGGKPVNVAVGVSDGVGLGIQGVRVIVSGPITRDATTVADGTVRLLALRPGTYRFRFEHEKFITLERDVTVRSGQAADLDVMLTRAPEKPKVEAPPPAPAPVVERASEPLPAASFDVAGYLEKDYLKSGANRLKSIACSGSDSVSLVQTTSSYAAAAGTRQMVAVAIAGQGRVAVGGRSSVIDSKSGTTVVVPANMAFEATREGRGTLVFVLVEIGAGCSSGTTSADGR
jgi:hypothetical protein